MCLSLCGVCSSSKRTPASTGALLKKRVDGVCDSLHTSHTLSHTFLAKDDLPHVFPLFSSRWMPCTHLAWRHNFALGRFGAALAHPTTSAASFSASPRPSPSHCPPFLQPSRSLPRAVPFTGRPCRAAPSRHVATLLLLVHPFLQPLCLLSALVAQPSARYPSAPGGGQAEQERSRGHTTSA